MTRSRSTVAIGFVYFAAIMMMITGVLDVLHGYQRTSSSTTTS